MSEETFEIMDGVRRAKAYELLGKDVITAEIVGVAGEPLEIREVPLERLFVAAKDTIDVSTAVSWERFMKIIEAAKAGSTLPPILVQPGQQGRQLKDVPLDAKGMVERSLDDSR